MEGDGKDTTPPDDGGDRKRSAHPPLRENSSTKAADAAGGSSATTEGNSRTYTDYSHLKPEDMGGGEDTPSSSLSSPFVGGGTDEEVSEGGNNKEPPFVAKLHSILSNPAFEDIVSWLPHGRAWRVHQRGAFEEQVIPLYFRHGKYSSFMRQVNGWGFQRINQGPDYGGYYHELFLRGIPHLATKIRRPTKPRSSPSRPAKRGRAKITEASLVEPPDFYKMAEESPLPALPPSSEFPPLPRRGTGYNQGESLSASASAGTSSFPSGTVGVGNQNAMISSGAVSNNLLLNGAVGYETNNNLPLSAAGVIQPLNFAQSAIPAMASVPITQQQMLMQTLLAQQYQISQQSQIAQQLQLQHLLSLLGGQGPQGPPGLIGNQINPPQARADDPNLSHLSSALLELQSQAMGGNPALPLPQGTPQVYPSNSGGDDGNFTSSSQGNGGEAEER